MVVGPEVWKALSEMWVLSPTPRCLGPMLAQESFAMSGEEVRSKKKSKSFNRGGREVVDSEGLIVVLIAVCS